MGQRMTSGEEERPSLLRRLLTFLTTLALALGAVALVANYDKLNVDAIKRYFTYRFLMRDGENQSGSFSYDQGRNYYAPLNGGLLVCTCASIRAYSSSGAVYLDQSVTLTNPVVSSSGAAALVYDVGGQDLFVFSEAPEPFSLSLEEGQQLLSARLNSSGWLAVAAQGSGHKGAVTVYDQTFEPVIQINLSSFVTDAVVSPDNKSVVISTVGLDAGGSFESRVNFYRLNRTEEEVSPDTFCPMGNNIGLDLRWTAEGIWFLGENTLCLTSSSGSLTGSYSYAGRYLKAFTLEGDGYAVLLLGKYRAGSLADLVVARHTGNVTATLSLTDQVLSLSAAGRYIAVLTADRLTIYSQDLQVYHVLEHTQGAQEVIMRDDGSAMLLGPSSARLYVPA